MKAINAYISEKFQVSKDSINQNNYNYHPKSTKELVKCIEEKIKKEGYGTKDEPLDLNDIDTSEINYMNCLFDVHRGGIMLSKLSSVGNFDISYWDVSNVENMENMFTDSAFNGDISRWDVSNVKTMQSMFYHSKFSGENGDISNWDVSGVKNMRYMFYYSDFNGDIKNWDVSGVYDMYSMFDHSPLYDNAPKWYYNRK